jgi:hypothetical protein
MTEAEERFQDLITNALIRRALGSLSKDNISDARRRMDVLGALAPNDEVLRIRDQLRDQARNDPMATPGGAERWRQVASLADQLAIDVHAAHLAAQRAKKSAPVEVAAGSLPSPPEIIASRGKHLAMALLALDRANNKRRSPEQIFKLIEPYLRREPVRSSIKERLLMRLVSGATGGRVWVPAWELYDSDNKKAVVRALQWLANRGLAKRSEGEATGSIYEGPGRMRRMSDFSWAYSGPGSILPFVPY